MVNGLYTLQVRNRIESSGGFFVIYFPFNLFNSVENENLYFMSNVVCYEMIRFVTSTETRQFQYEDVFVDRGTGDRKNSNNQPQDHLAHPNITK